MSFEYTEITERTWLTTRHQTGQDNYILVAPKDHSHVPIALPNWKPTPCCTTTQFRLHESELANFQVKPDDIWIASYPKAGTTWVQEMVWLICNELNFEKARSTVIWMRSPFLEVSTLYDDGDESSSFAYAEEAPSPRYIKTHLPVGLLPAQIWSVKPKIVYVRRNTKSVAVSYYHHSTSGGWFNGSKEAFMRSFMKDLQLYSPFHEHVIEYNELKYDNILQLSYEDMKRDLKSSVLKTCEFFGKSYPDEKINDLVKHLSFDTFKKNTAVNYHDDKFIREGLIDGWKKELSPEMIEELDQWTKSKVDEKHRHLFEV